MGRIVDAGIVGERDADRLIGRITGMDDDADAYARIEFTTFDRKATVGAFALAIEDDDVEVLAKFLADCCGRRTGADALATRFADLWNKGEYIAAARVLNDVCRVNFIPTIDLNRFAVGGNS